MDIISEFQIKFYSYFIYILYFAMLYIDTLIYKFLFVNILSLNFDNNFDK